MIVYPVDWQRIGQPIKIIELEHAIEGTLRQIHCDCLALSGGLDSSLLLYFMLKVHKQVKAFTIGASAKHRDVEYSVMVAEELGRTRHIYYVPSQQEIDAEIDQEKDLKGDKATRLFYKFVRAYTPEIISGDGIDEYMCGYYAHQNVETRELAYYEYIRRMQLEQIGPLNRNSEGVRVYLPYLNERLLCLLSQIPTYEKITYKTRKALMVEMAKGKLPDEVIMRRKIGFCDALEGRRGVK